jgi:hypothetical protein
LSAAGVYLYCIGYADQIADRIGELKVKPVEGSSGFRVIRSGDLVAVVGDTEIARYEIERDNLLAHQRVLEAAMKIADILPVSYGTVAEHDSDIIDVLLEGASDQLLDHLEHVRGRVELALRVMWDQERLFEEVAEEFEDIRTLRDALADIPEDKAYFERIRLGELTSNAIALKTENEAEQILTKLIPLSVDEVINANTSDIMVLNVSFLVDRDREAEFDEAVQEVAKPRQERMRFRYVGPLPPASFVSIVVEAER